MPHSVFRDPLTYPYFSALSVSAEEPYIAENPFFSYARHPTTSEEASQYGGSHGGPVQPGEGSAQPIGMFSSLTPNSPYSMDSAEISPPGGEELFVQPDDIAWPSAAETEKVLREVIKIAPSEPVALSALGDIRHPAKIPNLTYLAALAIWQSEAKRLTLKEMYDAIETRYPILVNNTGKKWKESLRHRLSLKAVFVRVGHPVKGTRGGYWALDVSKGLNANKRERKQGSGGSPSLGASQGSSHSLLLSDRDDQGTSDSYSDYSRRSHSSTSLSPHAPHEYGSVSPTIPHSNYQLSDTNISAHHGSSSLELAPAPYSPDNLLLHGGIEPLGYSSAQGSASTTYYAAGELDYERGHAPTPPSLNVSGHFFASSSESLDAGLRDLALSRDPGSSIRQFRSHQHTPDYNSERRR